MIFKLFIDRNKPEEVTATVHERTPLIDEIERLVMRDSEFKGSASWDMAIETLRQLPIPSDEETELMYLITRAKQISAQ